MIAIRDKSKQIEYLIRRLDESNRSEYKCDSYVDDTVNYTIL